MLEENNVNTQLDNYNGGPKTEEGKIISSQNSKTHGIFSSEFLSQEEEEEFDFIFKGILEDYNIQEGTAQAILALNLTMSFITLRRINKVEANILEDELSNNQSKSDLNLAKLNLLARYKVSAENGVYKVLAIIKNVGDDVRNSRFEASLRANSSLIRDIMGDKFFSRNNKKMVI
ncbi:MAG: hypothetical protein WCO35_03145 [Candidatus Nomurabacteria bacterium]